MNNVVAFVFEENIYNDNIMLSPNFIESNCHISSLHLCIYDIVYPVYYNDDGKITFA